MSQHDLDLANASGSAFRADANAALLAISSLQKGSGAPPTPVAGMLWLEDDNPSSTVWTVWQYDGADWIKVGQLDSTNNRFAAIRTMGVRDLVSFSSTSAATTAQVGFTFIFTGSSDATLNLPAAASLSDGASYTIRNGGSSDAILTIDPNSTEQINGATTLAVLAGESIDVVLLSGAWQVFGLPSGFRQIRRRTLSGAAASVELKLPADYKRFRLEFSGAAVATNGSGFALRMSVNGGTIFLSSTSDYDGVVLDTTVGGVAASGMSATGFIAASSALGTSFAAEGSIEWDARAGGQGEILMSSVTTAPTRNLRTATFYTNNATRPTDVQILTTSGNIAAGTFTLFGRL